MALSPEEITFYMVQAEEAYRDKDFNKAVSILNTIIKESPDYVPAYRRTGSILMLSQSQEKAQHYLKRAIELAPEDGENWKALGQYHKNRREWALALKAFSRSLSCSKRVETVILDEILQIQYILGDCQSAFISVQKLLQIKPDNIAFLGSRARILNCMGQKEKALEQYRLLIDNNGSKNPLDIIEHWYLLMLEFGLIKDARNTLWILSQEDQHNTALKWLYGKSCMEDLDHQEALSVYKSAYELAPDNIEIIRSLGILYTILDDTNNAAKYFSRLLDIDPMHISTLSVVYHKHKFRYGDDAFKRLNLLSSNISKLPVESRIELHYLLGKAYDDVDDPATAFEHFRRGGLLHAQGREKEVLDILQVHKFNTVKKMTGEFFEQNDFDACQSNKPLFIVGMPRSGTTLMEQVLSGIDGVYGAGELPFSTDVLNGIDFDGKKLFDDSTTKKHYSTYKERGEHYLELTEALAPESAKRIIDKMPDNFKFVGPLHLILPNASFIHSRRHPVETCLSAYRIKFAHGHYWSDDLRTMGRYYRLYTEMMAHWHSVLPEGTILDVRYEDMVNDLETQSKRIAAYIDMPWSPKCLEFHTSKKPVRTASLSQVRQPLYKTSMNRWRKYEPYLKPLLDEIGDLVEAYEKELETT